MRKKRSEKDYAVEKTVESIKILETLSIEPCSIKQIIERVGFIPALNRKVKYDAARSILFTLKLLGYARRDEKTTYWSKGHKTL